MTPRETAQMSHPNVRAENFFCIFAATYIYLLTSVFRSPRGRGWGVSNFFRKSQNQRKNKPIRANLRQPKTPSTPGDFFFLFAIFLHESQYLGVSAGLSFLTGEKSASHAGEMQRPAEPRRDHTPVSPGRYTHLGLKSVSVC